MRKSLLPCLLIFLAIGIAPGRLAAAEILTPIEPADTSSPRATLKSFRENFELAFRGFYETGNFDLIDRAAQARTISVLDISKLPPVQARRLAAEAALQLHDVLDRVKLPPYEEIPDAAAMLALPAGEPRRWQIHGTEIVIKRIAEGSKAGEYQFSSESVRRAKEFYDRAQSIPYQPGAMENFYRRIIAGGGPWIPTKLVSALPEWAKSSVGGQIVWKWVALLLAAIVWLLVVNFLSRLSKSRDGNPRYWLRFFITLAVMPLTKGIRWFIDQQLLLGGSIFEVVDTFVVIIYFLVGAVAIIHLGAAVAASLIASPRVDKNSIDANLISAGTRAVAWLLAIFLLAKGMSDLGVPLSAVVTSLGVGGLAFAMAARPTLENLIAGVTLYLDKPVRVGQYCQFGDVIGAIERIGLRSTRVRRWGGNLITIPNAQFAEFQLDNYNDARQILIRQKLRLRYETSADQLKFVLAKLREMLFAHPKLMWPRVRLVGFGDDALIVDVVAYCDTEVWSEWHAVREDAFLRVIEIIEASGTRLALPSQTTYFARDEGLDEDKKQAAEEQVHEWAEKGELPFPDMTIEQAEALSGTLDFPPTGSIGHKAAQENNT